MQLIRIIIAVSTSNRNEMNNTCKMLADIIEKEAGCMGCQVLSDINDKNCIIFEQKWETVHQSEDHFRTEYFSVLLGAMGFLSISHKIIINNGTPEKGMAAVKKARVVKS